MNCVKTIGGTIVLVIGLTVAIPGRQAGSEALVQRDLQAYMSARAAAFAGREPFSFGVYSDIHMCECGIGVLTRAQWAGLLGTWRDAGHSFGVIVGDLGYEQLAHRDNVLSGPAAVPTAPPVFYTMGNHELDSFGKRSWLDALYPGAVLPSSWTVLPNTPPGNADHAYWSFNVGSSTHFIMLDGGHMTWDGVTTRTWQSLGQAQLNWLKADLLANLNRNVMVFIHEPIDQQTTGSTPELMLTDRAALLELLAAHPKQKYVFSGHLHSHAGITRWKGVNSVHVQTGPLPMGIRVNVSGETITLSGNGTSTITDFDAHPMNQTVTLGGRQVLRVAEDGANAGNTRLPKMVPVGPENGVSPTSGSLMLKSDAMTWYAPRFISEQLVKIEPGMTLSYDIYLYGALPGKDAVTVQPHWYRKDGGLPPLISDQNFIPLSRKPRDGMFYAYNDDTPSLVGRASGMWYHREFDLTPMAGNYVDGLYLTSAAGNVSVSAVYVDDIRFTWPAPGSVVPAARVNVALASRGATATASSTYVGALLTAAINDERRSVGPGSSGIWADATPNVYPDWLEIAFSGVKTIDEVHIFTVPDVQTSPTFPTPTSTFSLHGVRDFQVQYWTGSTWLTVPGGAVTANNLVWRKIAFSPLATSRIRISITNALNLYSRIAEVEVYEAAGPAPPPNVPPSVTVINPASGATFPAPASLTISASASDVDGTVTAVSFHANGVLVGTDTISPYSVPWSTTAPGAYTLTATATDNAGATTTSAGINIAVGGSAPPTGVVFAGFDASRQGSWMGAYGGAGYNIIGDAVSYPSYATVSPTGQNLWIWASTTADVRALQKPSGGRVAGAWYGSTFNIDVNFTDALPHKLSLYALDWDRYSRSQRVDLLHPTTLAVLDSRNMSGFENGQYATWSITGPVKIRVTLLSGPNAVVSGLFFDNASTTSALFTGVDLTTQGSWIGRLGSGGYRVIGDTFSYPAFATVTSAAPVYVWNASTTDVRALQRAGGAGRVAGTWYGNVFDIGVGFSDGLPHEVALYGIDWDSQGRSQRFDVLDATTFAVLDSRTLSSFQSGQYLKWRITGNVVIRVTRLSGPNAVVSGLFLGPG